MLTALHAGEIDLLVGTQMIAKGHDVANVTLVGVVGSDAALSFPDFRAAERTFQLLTQVAGRAGRGETPGRSCCKPSFPITTRFNTLPHMTTAASTKRKFASAAGCTIRRSMP